MMRTPSRCNRESPATAIWFDRYLLLPGLGRSFLKSDLPEEARWVFKNPDRINHPGRAEPVPSWSKARRLSLSDGTRPLHRRQQWRAMNRRRANSEGGCVKHGQSTERLEMASAKTDATVGFRVPRHSGIRIAGCLTDLNCSDRAFMPISRSVLHGSGARPPK